MEITMKDVGPVEGTPLNQFWGKRVRCREKKCRRRVYVANQNDDYYGATNATNGICYRCLHKELPHVAATVFTSTFR